MAPSSHEQFLERCLLLDLETTTATKKLRRIGAIYQGTSFERSGRFDPRRALSDLDAFATRAELILGHNIVAHDLPILELHARSLKLLAKPAVDTLLLSLLAFPKNPYHPLIKTYLDDSLHRTGQSDPVADAQLAGRAFAAEWEELSRARGDRALDLYRTCYQRTGGRTAGLARALEALGARLLDQQTLLDTFSQIARGLACATELDKLSNEARSTEFDLLALAHVAAWFPVAGAKSILPHWLRRERPAVSQLVKRLRSAACGDASCAHCATTNDPRRALQLYFNLSGFVEKPLAPDGCSLQEAVVRAGIAERPLLAVIPTGGGKSIGYQLPALIRNQQRGALTIVISPLQALMKDQVDGFNQATGSGLAAAIHGMLTPLERGEALAGTRRGDVAILYVSPEQLRNRSVRRAIANRELGAWIFDEAHCLSHWGHDFRPDYLYAGRFIRELAELQGVPTPPVAAFTATAKREVAEEILRYFSAELGQKLTVFEAGVARDNLSFQVRGTGAGLKNSAVADLVKDQLADNAPERGAVIVYLATRTRTEEMAEYLRRENISAECFHAGLPAPVKRRVQDDFQLGATRVICATSAFGMGIDKKDVRLVIHAEVSGSLENYLQEAGRGGRDRQPARCVLLYDEHDVETQFRLLKMSELGCREIAGIATAIQRASRGRDHVVISTAEILRDEEAAVGIDAGERGADTRVKTAIAWLEKARLIERNENETRVFQGRPRVQNLREAERRIDALRLPNAASVKRLWLALLSALMNCPRDEALGADELAMLPEVRGNLSRTGDIAAGQLVVDNFASMARAGLIDDTLQCTAFVRWKVKSSSESRLAELVVLDRAMIDVLRAENPDADRGEWEALDLRFLNQRLLDEGRSTSPESLRGLLKSLENDGRGMAGERGSIELRYVARDRYQVRLQRDWTALATTAEKRRAVASVTLAALLGRVPREASPSADVLVSFGIPDLTAAIDEDLVLRAQVRDPLKAVERALMFLHEQKVIQLQQGLAVFRQAMTLRVRRALRRGWTPADHQQLEHHYAERIFQVHVIAEYARLGLAKISAAEAMVAAYFSLPKTEFVREFFADREEVLERATTADSYRRIVEDLRNPQQQAIVAEPSNANLLVLAGPGSGKTRVVVHRVAWLVRVRRIPPRSILVLAFNRSAVREVRRRLAELIDEDARAVTVHTYHALALRLTGRMLTGPAAGEGGVYEELDGIVERATELLRGKREGEGESAIQLDAEEVAESREAALAGWSRLLVDEYQDIDERQYQFISALAGRAQRAPQRKLTLLAVGDDDQNIYAFRKTNVEFIRKFESDYGAERRYLTENYRSTAHIIAVTNQLIAANRDRMKDELPITVDTARSRQPEGGRWAEHDRVSAGRTQVISVAGASAESAAITAEIQRLRALDPRTGDGDIAVLARHRAHLTLLRSSLEAAGVSVRWSVPREKLPPMMKLREVAGLLASLRELGTAHVDAAKVRELLEAFERRPDNPWTAMLREIAGGWEEETGGAPQSARAVADHIAEAIMQERREPAIGRGVLLSTIHAAKGMEFAHVLIPDAAAGGGKKGNEEEERRVLYVGMTRAKETLCLFEREDVQNVFLRDLRGPGILRRRAPVTERESRRYLRFELLDLGEVFVDYAARFAAGAPIHQSLARLQPFDPVRLIEDDGVVMIVDPEDVIVGMLSGKGAERWKSELHRVESARVLAVCPRDLSDLREGYDAKCREWAVPIVELVLSSPPARPVD